VRRRGRLRRDVLDRCRVARAAATRDWIRPRRLHSCGGAGDFGAMCLTAAPWLVPRQPGTGLDRGGSVRAAARATSATARCARPLRRGSCRGDRGLDSTAAAPFVPRGRLRLRPDVLDPLRRRSSRSHRRLDSIAAAPFVPRRGRLRLRPDVFDRCAVARAAATGDWTRPRRVHSCSGAGDFGAMCLTAVAWLVPRRPGTGLDRAGSVRAAARATSAMARCARPLRRGSCRGNRGLDSIAAAPFVPRRGRLRRRPDVLDPLRRRSSRSHRRLDYGSMRLTCAAPFMASTGCTWNSSITRIGSTGLERHATAPALID